MAEKTAIHKSLAGDNNQPSLYRSVKPFDSQICSAKKQREGDTLWYYAPSVKAPVVLSLLCTWTISCSQLSTLKRHSFINFFELNKKQVLVNSISQ